uniref:Mercuric reductase n=1 Tax=Corethron hystrix TaxID=216773 RepID=A0A7S1FK73_9STRA
MTSPSPPSSGDSPWTPFDGPQSVEARSLSIWPLDEHNAALLNEVRPRDHLETPSPDPPEYDLVALGAGAGGLVSSKQSARRGARSALVSGGLAGGDCLVAGCVPSKALLRSARAVAEVRKAVREMGVTVSGKTGEEVEVGADFGAVMRRLRRLRATIAPADSHGATRAAGADVYQGFGRLTGPRSLEVNGKALRFRKLVLATGGRPHVPPEVPGLLDAPYVTSETLFNLERLPPRTVVLGSGVIALEMAQALSLLGSRVTVVGRAPRLLSPAGDAEAGRLLRAALEKEGVEFLLGETVGDVATLSRGGGDVLPLLAVTAGDRRIECECLLVAAGRRPNVEGIGLEEAGVDYDPRRGVLVDDLARSVSNPDVYAVGDCVAEVPRLTHMAGEMAKVVVQNALAGDQWKLSSLVVPAVCYTHPEYAAVGVSSEEDAESRGLAVDVYRTGLEHNDRAILEGNNEGFVKIVVAEGTDRILGATIVAERAGEMLNEVTLAMRHGIGLRGIGRNVHAYPTMGEAVMGCGIQYINKHWSRLDKGGE